MGSYQRRYAAAVAAGQLSLALHIEERRARTNRQAVLEVLEAADRLLTGQEVAGRAGISYKQALDALTFLFNERRIARDGRKFTSRWGRLGPADVGYVGLQGFFHAISP